FDIASNTPARTGTHALSLHVALPISPGGEVMWKSERRPVRRIMSEETARVMRGVLGGVVDSGTAKAAQLTSYEVGGKSGTTRNADRKSTRLNSSHVKISYAVFCLKKK